MDGNAKPPPTRSNSPFPTRVRSCGKPSRRNAPPATPTSIISAGLTCSANRRRNWWRTMSIRTPRATRSSGRNSPLKRSAACCRAPALAHSARCALVLLTLDSRGQLLRVHFYAGFLDQFPPATGLAYDAPSELFGRGADENVAGLPDLSDIRILVGIHEHR